MDVSTADSVGDGDRSVADRPTVCVLTVLRGDERLLPGWLTYWGQSVGLDNVIVFDATSAAAGDNVDCTVFRIPGATSSARAKKEHIGLLNGFADGLLAVYDWVVAVRPGEVLLPDPALFDGLTEYLADRSEREVIAPLGLRPLRIPGSTSDAPALDERGLAMLVPGLCRPALKRTAAPWRDGGRGVTAPYSVDPALLLLDLSGAEEAAPVGGAEVPELAPETEPTASLVEPDGFGGFRVAKSADVVDRLVRLPDRVRRLI